MEAGEGARWVEALTVEARGPEFKSQHSYKSQAWSHESVPHY